MLSRSSCWATFGGVVVCLLWSGVVAAVAADHLQLRDGTVVTGKAIAFDGTAITFETAEGVKTFSRADSRAVLFDMQAPGGKGLPTGISLAEGLRPVRWVTFRRISRFTPEDGRTISHAKLSANGEKIVFSTYEQGVFTISADGTGLTQISQKRCDGLIDISADGSRVAWADEDGLQVARSDGTERARMPGEFTVHALRMTADGARMFILYGAADGSGIMVVQADGSGAKPIMGTKTVCDLLGIDENANHWQAFPSGLDISDDGLRIVFHLAWDAFAMNGDGSGLRRLTQYLNPEDRGLAMVRISGDGQRIAYIYHGDQGHQIVFLNWDGSPAQVHQGAFAFIAGWLQLTRDGTQAHTGWGWCSYDSDTPSHADYSSWFGFPGDRAPLERASRTSISADGRRACVVLDIGPQQLVVMDLNPSMLQGVPMLEDIDITPRLILNDGTTNVTMKVRSQGPAPAAVGVTALSDGFPWNALGGAYPLYDDGQGADATQGDGVFSTNDLRLRTDATPNVTAGVMTLRAVAVGENDNGLIVDFEGLEARNP